MAEKAKRIAAFLVVGIIFAVLGGVSFAAKMYMISEKQGIKDGYAQIIQVGSKQMSRSEYFDYANDLISKCNIFAIACLAIAVLFIVLFFAVKKKKEN